MSSPRRIVVVDDDPKVRLLLERAFRAPEFETVAFASAAKALERVAEIRPDCVVSDILMPDMDGESFLRSIREQPGLAHVPFVAVSAVRSEARIKSVLEAGADAFLVKPFPLRDLLDKIRSLLDRPAPPRAPADKASDLTSPTRPVFAAAHTMSTAAVPRRPRPAGDPPPAVRVVTPIKIVVPAPPPGQKPDAVAARRVELQPPDQLGFGRFTRVETRGRSFVVLTEAVAQPKFTVTTVITEKGAPLRRLETALPHPMAREEDRATVKRQIDLQHDGVLDALNQLVVDHTRRRVVWSDQNRVVEAGLLAWAMSAVAQMAESEAGTEEATRVLRLTRERIALEEGDLRAFHVTPHGRVVLQTDHPSRLPRRSVRAVAAWCRDFASSTLNAEADQVVEPVRQATRRYAAELERLGFYERLQGRSRA